MIRLPLVGIMYTRRRCNFISSFEFQVNLYDKTVVDMVENTFIVLIRLLTLEACQNEQVTPFRFRLQTFKNDKYEEHSIVWVGAYV